MCFIADHFQAETPDDTFIEEATYFEALKIMIQNGADVLVPRNWLSDAACFNAFNVFGGDNWFDEVFDERLWRAISQRNARNTRKHEERYFLRRQRSS